MRRFIFIVLLSLSGSLTFGQSWQWVQTYDYGSEDMPRGFGIDLDQNLYLLTNEYYDHGSTAHNYMYLCKYDAFGSEIWKDTVASNIRKSTTDEQGNTYCLGGGKVQAFDLNGTSIWSTGAFLAANQKDICHSKFLNDAQVCSYGYNSGIITSVVGSIKHDGSLRWTRVLDSTAAYLCASDLNGNLLVVSETFPDSATGNYCSLMKFDQNGDRLFNVLLPHLPFDVVTDTSGNIFISGTIPSGTPTNIDGTIYSAPFGSSNPNNFLLKYDSDGNLLWYKLMRNALCKLTTDSDGFLYLKTTGIENLVIDSIVLNETAAFMLIVKMDGTGNIVWSTKTVNAGTSGYITPFDIHCDNENNIYVAGGIKKSHQFGTYLAVGEHSYKDNFIAKLSQTPPTSTPDELFVSTDLRVSPNPAHGEISLTYTPSATVKQLRIVLRNTEGKELIVRQLENVNSFVSHKFEVSSFAPGIYFVDVEVDGLRMARKVITN
jgi:hypothetical protein